MKRPLAYITAAWCGSDHENTKLAAQYCRTVYETEEGCLSLDGVRKCVRYQEIEVEYEDINIKRQRQKYSGWTAQIIQHECDHLNGIII